MLAVLADDFSGAAEIAAIGRRYGLTAEVHTSFQPESRAELVVIDTHTRSSTREQAGVRVRAELTRLRTAGVDCIYYKKVDSVLRGHVAEELHHLLDLWELDRALLVPFNPSFGQGIRAGHYSIGGKPLNETRFAHDPEYPALTADVIELLGPHAGVSVAYCEDPRDMPAKGIVITGGVGREDLLDLVDYLDGHTLAAGAAEFFDAILQRRLGRRESVQNPPAANPSTKSLLILGSRSQTSRQTVADAHASGTPVISMPSSLYQASANGASMNVWVEAVVDALRDNDQVVVAAGEAQDDYDVPDPFPVDLLPQRFAELASGTLASYDGPLSLGVSGGTTASTIVRRLGWSALRVADELGQGVVTLNAPEAGRSITVKPGAYPWPEKIARALQMKGTR